MTHDEMVELLRGGVPYMGGTWADFGAGTGNFTRALRTLIGSDATLYAVDKDQRALNQQVSTVQTIHADFTRPIQTLPPLDGLLVANALHFVSDANAAMSQLVSHLKPGGVFLIVEYDVLRPLGYIPFPLPFRRFEKLSSSVGLKNPVQVGVRRSPSSGISMYAARAFR